MDAIILASAGKASKLVFGENKAFLLIQNRTVLEWVLEAVVKASGIKKVVVVGPASRLSRILSAYQGVEIVEQTESLYQNALQGIYQAFGIKDETQLPASALEKPVLILSSDIPILVSEEIEYFLKKADLNQYDFIYGVCAQEVLKKFASRPNQPGVDLACFHTDRFSGRIANMVIVKPFQVRNRDLLDQAYNLRYQKNPINILKTVFRIITLFQPSLLWNYLWLQAGLQAEKKQKEKLAQWAGKRVKLEKLLSQISHLLGLRFGILETPFGGSALDADNERDFLVISQRFEEWKKEQKKIGAELKAKGII